MHIITFNYYVCNKYNTNLKSASKLFIVFLIDLFLNRFTHLYLQLENQKGFDNIRSKTISTYARNAFNGSTS